MRIKATAKINWALNVLSRRPDGYHELDMLNQRLTLSDEIVLTPAKGITLSVIGSMDAPGDERNLAWRAAALMQGLCPSCPGVHISLDKRIPSGAGLGGGSADAAAVMLGLNELWGMKMPLQALRDLGKALGADVPYCLGGGFARVGGIGERISPIPGARAFNLVLLQPEESLSTKQVFEQLPSSAPGRPADIPGAIQSIRQYDPASLHLSARNQLQQAALAHCPTIGDALHDLSTHRALFAQMSGAGSLVYGVFADANAAMQAAQKLQKKWGFCLFTQTIPS